MIEKRRTVRQTSSIPATLAAAHVEVSCTILDISRDGARLSVRPGFFLSSACFLRTPELGRAVPSRIVWRRRTEIGMAFK